MRSFWRVDVADDLSQGDLLGDTWIGSQPSPRVGLKRGATAKGGSVIWNEQDTWTAGSDGCGYFLGRGRQAYSLVLSHSCEIDKRGGKAPVLVAPVLSLLDHTKDESQREFVRAGRRYAFFYLGNLPCGLDGEFYADLRAITYLPRAVLDELPRIASGSGAGVQELSTHLVAFFTRVPMADIRG